MIRLEGPAKSKNLYVNVLQYNISFLYTFVSKRYYISAAPPRDQIKQCNSARVKSMQNV